MTNSTLPVRTPGYRDLDNVSEQYAEQILDAIHAGKQLSCHSRPMEGGDDVEAETCVTEFDDPRLGTTRFALEVWSGSLKSTYDFATAKAALNYQVAEDDKLGL
jgi:hypothetical protein